MKSPEERIRIIEASLRCFRRSLWGFIPIIGLIPAVSAIAWHRRTRRLAGNEWNPAQTYLNWGIVLGWLALGMESILIGLLMIAVWAAVLK